MREADLSPLSNAEVKNSAALVRKRTTPTERPSLAGEVSSKNDKNITALPIRLHAVVLN
jgi:hypothetical protein